MENKTLHHFFRKNQLFII